MLHSLSTGGSQLKFQRRGTVKAEEEEMKVEMCVMRCSTEMPNISYAWKDLKEQLDEDIDSK